MREISAPGEARLCIARNCAATAAIEMYAANRVSGPARRIFLIRVHPLRAFWLAKQMIGRTPLTGDDFRHNGRQRFAFVGGGGGHNGLLHTADA